MNILNTLKLPCEPCGKKTDHFISAALNQRVCSECWHVTPAQPEDFFMRPKPKPEMIIATSGGPEKRV